MGGQVVDTVTAEEFMQQVLQKVSRDELGAIAADAAHRAGRVRTLLTEQDPTPDALRSIIRGIFGVRRRADSIIDDVGGERFVGMVRALLDDAEPLPERIDAFTGGMAAHEAHATDIASTLLHWVDPGRYWLWTRWMWDPRTETGSLRLVTMEEFDMFGETPGATYLRVGEAVAFVHETGRAVGFTALGHGPFGIDTFLACTYGIYMYTVLRMRMTQEFNHVVPQLPELARRLLGVYRLEDD